MRKLAIAAGAVMMMAGAASADFFEDFNGAGAFPWDVVDLIGGSTVLGWDYNYNIVDGTDPRGNFSSGDGGAAHADTDAFGPDALAYDVALLSPVSTVSAGAVLVYNINFQQIGAIDAGRVEITADGGATWDLLAEYLVDTGGFPTFPYSADEPLGIDETIDLAAYAGQDVQVRFRYVGEGWNWFMQVDNVGIIPAPGAVALFGVAGLMARRRR